MVDAMNKLPQSIAFRENKKVRSFMVLVRLLCFGVSAIGMPKAEMAKHLEKPGISPGPPLASLQKVTKRGRRKATCGT